MLRQAGTDCGELFGGPVDGKHVHTTPAQGQACELVVAPTTGGRERYYLRARRDDGMLVWVHASLINAAAQQPPTEGGEDG